MSTTDTSTPRAPNGAASVDLEISGMSCGHCVAAVQSALRAVPGLAVERVAVGAAQVAIAPSAGDTEAVVARAVDAIEAAGYTVRRVAAHG